MAGMVPGGARPALTHLGSLTKVRAFFGPVAGPVHGEQISRGKILGGAAA